MKESFSLQRKLSPSSLYFGAEGEIRTLEASLEDSHVSSYITPAETLKIANCRFPIGVVRCRRFCAGMKIEQPHRTIGNWQLAIENVWNSWQDSNPQPRRSKRRTLPVELQERKRIGASYRIRTGVSAIGNAVS